MAGGLTPEVRLVRCPKCRNVLPELPDVPVYKCGGCETILIAKNRKFDTKSLSSLCKKDAAKTDDKSECKEPSPICNDSLLPSSEECSLEQNNERGNIEFVDQNSKQLDAVNVVNEDEDNGSQQYKSENCNIEQYGVSSEACSSVDDVHENEEISPVASENSKVEANDAPVELARAESEIDVKGESQTNYVDPLATRGGDLSVPDHMPASESISRDIVESCFKRKSEEPLESDRHTFDRVMSTDTFATSDFYSPSSEFSGTLDYFSKSATIKSSCAYYDGSVSSYDRRDDQFSGQDIKFVEHNSKYTGLILPQVRNNMLDEDKFLANSVMSSKSGMQKKAAVDKHYAIGGNKWDEDEFVEPSRLGHPVRNWTRLAREEYHSQRPLYPTGYESCSPSTQMGNSSAHSLETAEQEQMKLLRMIYELQEQLHRTNLLSVKASAEVNWKQKSVPICYDGEALDQSYHDFNYARRSGTFGPESRYFQQTKFFSGGATPSGNQTDNSCFCCHSRDWQCSRQLPVPALQYNRRFSRFHPAHIHYASDPSSPQRYKDSEFFMQHSEIQSDDQRHRGEMKMHLRERHLVVKRHIRPTAGGAPFVTCYHCFKALQLPEDFLIFKKSCHRLRCGACSKVLKFSLENGTHIVQPTPGHVDPPPRHGKDNVDIKSRSFASTFNGYDDLGADSVSCSDNFGPYHNSQNNTAFRKMSYDSSEERRKVLLKQCSGKQKNSSKMLDLESVVYSSSMPKSENVSSGFRELHPARGSLLHQLMGYSSPSQVLRGSNSLASGTSLDHSEDLSLKN